MIFCLLTGYAVHSPLCRETEVYVVIGKSTPKYLLSWKLIQLACHSPVFNKLSRMIIKSQIHNCVQAALASSSSHLAVLVTVNYLKFPSLWEHQVGSSGVTRERQSEWFPWNICLYALPVQNAWLRSSGWMLIFRKHRSIWLRDIEQGYFLSVLGYQRKQHACRFPWEGVTLVGTGVQGVVPCAPIAAVHGDVWAVAWAGLPHWVHPEELGPPASGVHGNLLPTPMFSNTFFGPLFNLLLNKCVYIYIYSDVFSFSCQLQTFIGVWGAEGVPVVPSFLLVQGAVPYCSNSQLPWRLGGCSLVGGWRRQQLCPVMGL